MKSFKYRTQPFSKSPDIFPIIIHFNLGQAFTPISSNSWFPTKNRDADVAKSAGKLP